MGKLTLLFVVKGLKELDEVVLVPAELLELVVEHLLPHELEKSPELHASLTG